MCDDVNSGRVGKIMDVCLASCIKKKCTVIRLFHAYTDCQLNLKILESPTKEGK